MDKENTKVVYKGLGFLNILTIIFIIAKICGAITWSWWLVIINVGLSILIWLVIFVVVIVAAFLD